MIPAGGAARTGLAARLLHMEARLLVVAARLVPAGERPEWSRGWQAELWHMHDRGVRAGREGSARLLDFYVGLVLDALWLRGEAWRRKLHGTPVLCLGFLFGLNLIALLPALLLRFWSDGQRGVQGGEMERSLLASPLIVFVAFAVAPRRHTEDGMAKRGRRWLRRQIFFGAKTSLVLSLMFLLSGDLLEPVAVAAPNVAEFLQIFGFLLLALLGLRWAILDQDGRCKQCLQVLAGPAQVGRPSHNLLEWNGVAMACKRGHGRLNVPELETSWDASGRWVDVEIC